MFNAVWDLVNRKHFDPKFQGVDWNAAAAEHGRAAALAPDDSTLYREINAMLAPLHDSHTRALTPTEVTERHTQQRARTGFSFVRLEGKWVVTEVLPDSPAERAGVKVGFIIVSRNGEPPGRIADFRPKEGDVVTWEFLDQHDQLIKISAVAQRLSIAARQIERELEGGVIYLRFDEFDGIDRRWLSHQLKQHAAAPAVVIDLRHNPGGETFSLGITIGEFFDHAVDCGTFISRDGLRDVKNSWQLGSAHYHGKVIILTEGGTGSAAEIFSAVLQANGRAKIVGRKTAGAVLASMFYHLPGGGELQLSLEDYVAPNGRRIEGNGIEPNVIVARTLADLRTGTDRDLEEALKLLKAGG